MTPLARFLVAAATIAGAQLSAATLTDSAGSVNTTSGTVTTGAQSRAELTGDNGLIVRAGSNAEAGVNETSRTVTVGHGSVLVSAPAGATTTVKTKAGDITTEGGTLILTVGKDGGVKLHVLAGEAELNSAAGESATVEAGRMTLAGPGGSGDLPVLDFDLARLADTSRLVKGFAKELSALGAIRAAASEQGAIVSNGKLRRTGLVVLGANGGEEFRVAPHQALASAINARAALEVRNLQLINFISLGGEGLAAGAMTNLGAGTLTLSGSNTYGGAVLINAGTLQLINEGVIDLSGLTLINTGTESSNWGGAGSINFGGTLGGAGTYTPSTLSIYTSQTGFNMPFFSSTPTMTVATGAGDITLTNCTFTANDLVFVPNGTSLTFDGGAITAKTGGVTVGATGNTETLTIKNTAITTLTALQGVKFGNASTTTLNADGTTFSVPTATGIAMDAKTLNLQNINFPAESVITLRSRDGILNIGDSQVGAVNFITNVKYNGADLTTVEGINAHVNAPHGVTQNGSPLAGAAGNAAGAVTIGKLPN